MPRIFIGNDKDLLRLCREVLLTLRIQYPSFPRSDALNKLVSDSLYALSRAGVKEAELSRSALTVAQKFIRQF